MARYKDENWTLPDEISFVSVQTALLMDLRDELKRLNALLHCDNFQHIPRRLMAIQRNTTRPVRKKHARP